jgi:glutaredoxin
VCPYWAYLFRRRILLAVRCEEHGLACGPDGFCVLCRREAVAPAQRADGPALSPSRYWLGLGAAAAIAGAASAYRVYSLQALSHPRAPAAGVGAAAEPPTAAGVVVYTTAWCPVCKRAKAWMQARGIPYEERDVERSREHGRAMHAINPRGSVPTFDVDGEVLVGFSETNVLAAMDRAAQRSESRRH